MYWYYIQPSSIQLDSQVLYGICNKKSIEYTSFHYIQTLLISGIKKYIAFSNLKQKEEILHNLNLVLQNKLDINTLNKKFLSNYDLDGLLYLINIKNNQIIMPEEAEKFLVSFNKISKYIDYDNISRFENIFKESIKSNSHIRFKKQSKF